MVCPGAHQPRGTQYGTTELFYLCVLMTHSAFLVSWNGQVSTQVLRRLLTLTNPPGQSIRPRYIASTRIAERKFGKIRPDTPNPVSSLRIGYWPLHYPQDSKQA